MHDYRENEDGSGVSSWAKMRVEAARSAPTLADSVRSLLSGQERIPSSPCALDSSGRPELCLGAAIVFCGLARTENRHLVAEWVSALVSSRRSEDITRMCNDARLRVPLVQAAIKANDIASLEERRAIAAAFVDEYVRACA